RSVSVSWLVGRGTMRTSVVDTLMAGDSSARGGHWGARNGCITQDNPPPLRPPSTTSVYFPVSHPKGPTHPVPPDHQNTPGQTASMTNDGTNGKVTGLSPATINYVNAGTDSLTVHGGSGGNTFTVNGTLVNAGVPNTPTTLDKGSGPNNTVNVTATTAGS